MTPFENTLQAVRRIAESFDNPDDDFAPMMILETKGGDEIILLPLEMGDSAQKDVLAELIIPRVIREVKAEAATLVLSAWAVSVKEGDDLGDEMPSTHPDRVEMVLVTRIAAEGITDSRVAFINRDPRGGEAPTLTEFEQGMTEVMEGRFHDPIVATLNELKEMS